MTSPGRSSDPPLRVCILLESYYPIIGGGEIQGQALAEGLVARGVPTRVVTLLTRPDLAPHERLDGYEVLRVGSGRDRWRGVGPAYRALRRLAPDYDLLYVSGFRILGLAGVLGGKRGAKRVVLKAQNNGELSGGYFDPELARLGLDHRSAPVRPFNALRKAVLRRADHFVVMARSVERECLEAGVPPGKISLIPDGIDLRRFRPRAPQERLELRRKLGLPEQGIVVCFTGRLVAWKGAMNLMKAWREVLQARGNESGSGAVLLFVGSGGTDSDNCEEEARAFQRVHQLEEAVRFTGDVRNVDEYLGASDIYAFPTLNDLFPLSLLEAMASGLPPVTTRVAGLADYVVAEQNALVVPPGDVPAVREALMRLLADPDLRDRLGREALATAQQFSLEHTVDRFHRLFRRLVRPGPGVPDLDDPHPAGD